ncbi:1-phosphofructokinase family hexose kinase [Raineyella sp. W15-4]|uniref:1-phosphofructokinase family hexose kinase n=1 Tax=Raineyella sp. W15-4 TaxID=3081651 RepID=UPI002953DBF9|nr:1-phosphofructokinase family hexose kinase [Raineyella sp. W15-4]WOQ17448.1 1-phosphofructokinase family hexose kinase [Raineyella sp. W15-4]
MIVTFTANPSIDRTAELDEPLLRGGVNRIRALHDGPGGKGVNVSRALHLAEVPSVAVLPSPSAHPIVAALREAGVAHRPIPVTGRVRTNITLSEDDGTTTKINEPGSPLDPDGLAVLRDTLVDLARDAAWVALCGSLPPGPRADWYADLVDALRPTGARIAVDTSDAPLEALAARLPGSAPDLLKPNAFELGQLTGTDGDRLERAAEHGDFGPTVRAARAVVDQGVRYVLATLGAAGAVLASADGAWTATPPAIVPISTVGAGDSSLAGFLLAHVRGDAPADCLRHAVAYGSAATALPGTTVPRPDQTDPDGATVAAYPAKDSQHV